MARYTINYLTGATETVDANSVAHDHEARQYVFHKQEHTYALGMDRLRDWDDIRNAAAGMRKQRDSQAEAIERVRQLHQAVDYRGAVICRECSGYGGQSTDNAPVNHDKCGTLLALAGERPAAHRDITVDNAAEVVAAHDPSRRA